MKPLSNNACGEVGAQQMVHLVCVTFVLWWNGHPMRRSTPTWRLDSHRGQRRLNIHSNFVTKLQTSYCNTQSMQEYNSCTSTPSRSRPRQCKQLWQQQEDSLEVIDSLPSYQNLRTMSQEQLPQCLMQKGTNTCPNTNFRCLILQSFSKSKRGWTRRRRATLRKLEFGEPQINLMNKLYKYNILLMTLQAWTTPPSWTFFNFWLKELKLELQEEKLRWNTTNREREPYNAMRMPFVINLMKMAKNSARQEVPPVRRDG